MADSEQRVYIKYRTVLGASAISIHDDLVTIHGDNAYKMSTIYKWIERFKAGRDDIEDDPRSGRPIAAGLSQKRCFLSSSNQLGHCLYYQSIKGIPLMLPTT
jgi:transposase